MTVKASDMLAAISADLPKDHPVGQRLKKALALVKELEERCDELRQDSQKMARALAMVRTDAAIAECRHSEGVARR